MDFEDLSRTGDTINSLLPEESLAQGGHGLPAVTRVLLIGDMHGNTGAAFDVLDYAADVGVDLVLQVGDYGWWPRDLGGQKFIRKVESRLALRGLDLWWIDGNHEDFDRLEARPVDADGRRQLSDHVWHLPRGFRWRWGDVNWVAVGGAASVDKYRLIKDKDWFAAEELTDEQADLIVAGGPADVVVAHDAPLGVPFLRKELRQDLPAWRRDALVSWPVEALMRSDEHQRRVRRVVDGVEAKRVFHGHHHIRYSDTLEAAHGPVQVEGLGMDEDSIASRSLLVDGDGERILGIR